MRSYNRPHRLTAAALAVAALGLGLLVSAPAFAAAPPVPAGLSVSQPNTSTTILGWTLVEGATKYEVQVDNDPGFASPELSSTTTNRRIVPTTALPPGQVYWHVRAVNDQNEKSDWSVDQFTVAGVAKPAPQSPADGSLLPQPSSPPLLSWSGSQGATSYTVEVDGDSDFIGATSYTTKTTSLVVPDPLGAGDYWWRVTATKGPGIVSEPSDASTFVIAALPAPVLVSPNDSVNVPIEDVVLDWSPVPGAKTYDVQVALDEGFNNMVLDVEDIQGTRYSPPVTLNNDQFWWRVRAVDLAGQPTAWTASNFGFQRQWLDKPQAVFPAGLGRGAVDADDHPSVLRVDPGPARQPLRAVHRQRPELLARRGHVQGGRHDVHPASGQRLRLPPVGHDLLAGPSHRRPQGRGAGSTPTSRPSSGAAGLRSAPRPPTTSR